MTQLAGDQVAQLADVAGIPRSQLVTAVAIAWAESGLRTDAIGENRSPVTHLVTSRDRGLWQINDYWHPDVSDVCAFDATCNAQAMARISSYGTNWSPWSTFNSGAFRNYLSMAQLAVNYYLTGSGGAGGPPGAQATGGYRITAGAGLIVHSLPSLTSPSKGTLPYNTAVSILCQDTGSNYNGSTIWDHIVSPIDGWVTDYYVNTPVFAAFSPGLPKCGAAIAALPSTAVDNSGQIVRDIAAGYGPIGVTAHLLQRLVDETMDAKYGPGKRTGPIMGGIIA